MKKIYFLIIFLCIRGLCSCNKNLDPGANPQLNVYVVGSENNGVHRIAKYWKNGIPVSLSDGSMDADAFSIAVSGNDMYVAGTDVNAGTNSVAKYWKNGIPVNLTTNTNVLRMVKQ